MQAKKRNFLYEERLSENQINLLNSFSQKVREFCKKNQKKPIVLLTSGGTSVPLQKKAVRFLENMSTGLRGSLLAEKFLNNGVAVIFYHRQGSFLPFSQGITVEKAVFNNSIHILNEMVQSFKQYEKQLLLLPFKSVYQYLNGILQLKKELPPSSIIVLCAAVSDFIPAEVTQHKIHTAAQLTLHFISSPKILKEMVSKDHLCVSFKLETDEQKLGQRVAFALEKYEVDLVIGNILGNRKQVTINYNNRMILSNNKEISINVQESIVNTVLEARRHKFDLN